LKRTAEDGNSNVWITSSHGLWKFDRKSGNFYHYTFQPDKPGSISGNDPVAIDRDAGGNIWIATKSAGLNRIVFGSSQKGTDGISFKRYSKQSGDLISDSLINIMAGNKHNLWVMGRNGLARYNPEKDSFIPYTMEGKWVLRMAESIHGGYWLKTRNDFYWFDTTNNILTEYTDYEGFRNMQKKNFYICNKGCVWTTFEGYGIHMIYSWKNPLMQLFNKTKPEGLSADQRKINRILIDKKDNLWLGTYGGLIRVPRFSGGFVKGFRTYSHDPSDKYSLPHNNILALLETKDGSIWIGTENGLSKYIPENERFQNFNHEPNNPLSLQQKYVHDLCEDSRGILWVQTQNGPDLLDRETGRFYHLNDFSEEVDDDFFVAIAEDSSGALWLGDFEKGLTRIEIPGKLPGKENVIKEVLNSFQVRHFRNIPSEPYSLSGNSIVSLYTDSKKRFWVGTGNGLNLFLPEQNQFICINKTDGLENETVCGILDDSDGNIWLSSKRGITKIIPANHQVSLDFKKGLTLINFSMGDGLQGLEYIEKSFFKSGSGTMFFGGFNGFNYFDPDSVQAVTDFPVPYLTGFYKLNNRVFFEKPLYEMDSIRLKYNENKFSIEFVGLGFKKNNRVKYRYMLENFDKEWTISGKERKAGYMSLSPGEYRFKVQVSNESGDWNNQFASVFILINPPFWNTWWFKSLAILCTFLLVFFFVKSREQNLKLQKRKLESQVKERTIEISLRNTELQQKQEELRAQNQEIAIQRDMLDFQNKSINESILYAKRIQSAVLPRQEYIDEILPENFIFFKPRDIVSGDFYWIRQVNHYVVIAVADCTGHGVPGAIMSMLGITLLNEILHKREITSTNQALNELRKQVKQTLRQTGKEGATDTGMDIALCALDKHTNVLQYSGANNNLYLIQKEKFIEIKADRMPIGFYPKEIPDFTNHEIKLEEGDVFYLFTDGFIDQFGGRNGFKYKAANFQKFLFENHRKPMVLQREMLEKELSSWMNSYDQTDDILVMGVRV
jgi:serine phosphatase RsbU (regulator of sigma subunit)/ligand-binding sensor domain-containing protein